MTMSQLHCFLSVARTLNFTKSANELYFTQSHLSKQIAALEKELGFPLFIRTSHTVTLTPQGSYLAQQLRDIPEQIDLAINAAQFLGQTPVGVMRMGALEGLTLPDWMLTDLQQFHAAHPTITQIQERKGFRALWEGLVDGSLDIITTHSSAVPTQENYSRLSLGTFPMMLVFHQNHPLSKLSHPTLSDCSGITLAVLEREESFGSYQLAVQTCERAGCQPERYQEFPSIEAQMFAVECNSAVAMLPCNNRLLTSPFIRSFPIEGLQIEEVTVWRTGNPNLNLMLNWWREHGLLPSPRRGNYPVAVF